MTGAELSRQTPPPRQPGLTSVYEMSRLCISTAARVGAHPSHQRCPHCVADGLATGVAVGAPESAAHTPWSGSPCSPSWRRGSSAAARVRSCRAASERDAPKSARREIRPGRDALDQLVVGLSARSKRGRRGARPRAGTGAVGVKRTDGTAREQCEPRSTSLLDPSEPLLSGGIIYGISGDSQDRRSMSIERQRSSKCGHLEP